MRTELHWQVCGGRQKSTMRLCKMNRASMMEEVRARLLVARCLQYYSCDTNSHQPSCTAHGLAVMYNCWCTIGERMSIEELMWVCTQLFRATSTGTALII
jgi:hypothetical protein